MANNFALRSASDLPDMLPLSPRSQRDHDATVAAYQQARRLYRILSRYFAGKSLPIFEFHDHGSLVSLGRFDAVGNLMEKPSAARCWPKVFRHGCGTPRCTGCIWSHRMASSGPRSTRWHSGYTDKPRLAPNCISVSTPLPIYPRTESTP